MTDEQRTWRYHAFCSALEALDTGSRARLKRCAGRELSQSLEVVGLFYRLLPSGVPVQQEETYFLLATLYPMTPASETGSLGNALAKARNDLNSRGLDRRVEALLDADETQLPFRLRQAIHFLQSNRVGVDWARLLDDLLHWTMDTRYVQKAWARDYYTESAE